MAFDYSGKTALVTGASYGLGEVFAKDLAASGAELVLTARSADMLEAVAEACREAGSPKVTTVTGDVSVEADVVNVVATGVAEHGKVDLLVNNAGVADMRGVPAEKYDMDTFNWIMSVDLNGAFMMLRECGAHMLEHGGGSIVNICSIMGNGGNELNVIPYTAAKGGLRNLTLQLGCEWADRGVRVNSVSPGFILTDMIRAAVEGTPNADYIASRTPMRRMGDASEVSNAVLFLGSDLASYITGVDLNVDGGTNAGNGYYQVQPIHHEWGSGDTAMASGVYQGLTPRPEGLEAMSGGIPGIHYELPEE